MDKRWNAMVERAAAWLKAARSNLRQAAAGKGWLRPFSRHR
jgi:hypothetical protein